MELEPAVKALAVARVFAGIGGLPAAQDSVQPFGHLRGDSVAAHAGSRTDREVVHPRPHRVRRGQAVACREATPVAVYGQNEARAVDHRDIPRQFANDRCNYPGGIHRQQ